MNTRRPLARLLLAFMFLALAPFGGWVLAAAFDQHQPHIFVMLIFSGSLSLLVGLAGLVGFIASFGAQGVSAETASVGDEEPPPSF